VREYPDKEAVRVRIDIVELIGEVVTLRRVGRDWVGLCPFHRERMPSFSVSQSRGTYHCFGCAASGDAFSFVQATEGMGPDAVEYLNRRVGGGDHHRLQRAVRRGDGHTLSPPPAAEVSALWQTCVPVGGDAEVSGWLCARALDPHRIDDEGLARAVPGRTRLPGWARGCRRWWTEGHRLIVPLFDHTGTIRSLHARAVVPNLTPKSLSPAGCGLRGLVMADPGARLMLAGHGEIKEVWIAEGVPDHLSLAFDWNESDDSRRAVLGVIAGSWDQALADRIPVGTTVMIATDNDAAGDRYADVIKLTLTSARRRGVTLQRARVRVAS
jgi:hypothetical protein